MEQCDRDFIDMVSPGEIAFAKGGAGRLHFGCVDAEMDWRFDAETERVEFTFAGVDEGDEVHGRGWAEVQGDRLTGRIVFHQGDESGLVASKPGV